MAQQQQPPQEGVQVHVCLGGTAPGDEKQHSARSTAELLGYGSAAGQGYPGGPACRPSPASSSTGSGGPAWLLWFLFVLGFICPPFWWAGSILGLHRRKKARQSAGLSSSATAAWHGCIAMSIISTVAVVLGVALHYGRKPAGEVPGHLVCEVELVERFWLHFEEFCVLEDPRPVPAGGGGPAVVAIPSTSMPGTA
jgi:hypothetical protein